MTTINNGESGLSVRTKLNDVLQHIDGTSGTLVINESGADVDFRVESDTVTNALFVDGGSGNVGVGTSSPQAKLQVLDQLKVSSADQSSGVVALGDGSSTQFGVGIARWNGSTNSTGAGGVGYFAQGPSNAGGHFFYTGDAAAGSTTERMRIDSSGNVLVGTTVLAGDASNTAVIVNGGTRTASGNLSIVTAVATTIFSITGANRGRYEVIAMIPNSGDAAIYSAVSTVLWDGTTGRAISNNGTGLTITLSGSDVKVTQTAGSTQAVYWSFQRIAL